MRKLFNLLVVLSFVVCFICLGLAPVAGAKDVKVGAVINLTGPGSSMGQAHAKGLEDYVRYINKDKGGISGNKINFTLVDHAYKIPEAVKLVKKFCTLDKKDFIITWDAGSGISIKPVIQRYKIPTFNLSVYQGLLKPPINYLFIITGTYAMDAVAIMEYIFNIHKGSGPPKVGLLGFNNTFGKAIHGKSKEYAAKHNMNIVSIEEFPPRTVDLNTELLRLKNKGAEYIFIQATPGAIILALKSADRIKYNVPFIGTVTSTDPTFFNRAKGLIRDRFFMSFCGGLPSDGTPGVKLMMKLGKKYRGYDKFDNSYWFGISMGMIMEKAFHKALNKFGKLNSKTINDALESFRNEDFGGLLPNMTYTKTNHRPSYTARIVKVNEGGTYTPVTSFWAPGKEKVTILR